jgi:hypothetical protein
MAQKRSRLSDFQRLAECNSAIRQIENLRYGRIAASKSRHCLCAWELDGFAAMEHFNN